VGGTPTDQRVGVVFEEDGARDVDELLQAADAAMPLSAVIGQGWVTLVRAVDVQDVMRVNVLERGLWPVLLVGCVGGWWVGQLRGEDSGLFAVVAVEDLGDGEAAGPVEGDGRVGLAKLVRPMRPGRIR
jgi:hypothetical protein